MRKLFLFTLLVFVIVSCEKTLPDGGVENPTPAEGSDYFPLIVGSYWVYEHIDIDPLGQETVRAQSDSVTITRDTLINGSLYYVLEGSNYPFNGGKWGVIDILRDSVGYIVSSHGEVKLSSSNFTDTLTVKKEMHAGEVLYTLSYRMEKEDLPCQVPAGTFNVINYKGTVVSYQDREDIPNPRYLNTLYAEGVGNVLRTYFYFSSPNISEKRLLRYYIPR